jgi:hypothetical protein
MASREIQAIESEGINSNSVILLHKEAKLE